MAIAFSDVGIPPRGRSAELRLEPDGELTGFDGCTEITGRWETEATDRLSVTDLSPPSERCESPEAGSARLVRKVLAGQPAMGPFESMPDSLRLSVGDDFVGFTKDVSYGTPTNPARSGEMIELADGGFELLADSSSVVDSALPAETRAIRWRATGGESASGREVWVHRTLGGMPFSLRAVLLATAGARATEVEVQGRPAALTIADGGGGTGGGSIAWAPHDDVTLTLRFSGFTIEEALQIADKLSYDRGKLRSESLTAARSLGRENTTPAQIAAEGALASGVPWKFVVFGSDAGTCTQLLLASGASGECGPPEDAVDAEATRVLGEVVVHGSTPETGAKVRIEWDGGRIDVDVADVRDFPGRRYYAATAPRDVIIRRVIASDASGAELARQEPVSTGGAIGNG